MKLLLDLGADVNAANSGRYGFNGGGSSRRRRSVSIFMIMAPGWTLMITERTAPVVSRAPGGARRHSRMLTGCRPRLKLRLNRPKQSRCFASSWPSEPFQLISSAN